MPSTLPNKVGSDLDNKIQNELLSLKNKYFNYDKLRNGKTADSMHSMNDSFRTFYANDPKQL